MISVLTPVSAQQTLFPGRVPLSIRSPYLSSWVSSAADTSYTAQWPDSVLGSTLGWVGFVRLADQNKTFSWLGFAQGGSAPGVASATLRRTIITPTQTIITLDAGTFLEINVTFISPIEVGNPVKQSIPFSYLVFEARSLDNQNHTVQVYSDISGEWNSADSAAGVKWTSITNRPNDLYHSVSLQTPASFQENGGLATWGTVHYATRKDGSVTYTTAPDIVARPSFVANGTLDGQLDATFRAINGNTNLSWPVFSFAKDLGSIRATATPIVYAIGHTFETDDSAAVQYKDLTGTTTKRALYYASQYNQDVGSLIDDFLSDFEAARTRAHQVDDKITGAASSAIAGPNYADLVSLATRQVFGTTQLSVAKGTDGTWNTSDVMMFMRDTGAANPNRVNPVETLYASFPMFMHIDPSLGAPLLEPLLRFQTSSQYTISFAAADLAGTGYPSAQGSNIAHNQSVEQTGNMLIMAYAQAQASGDNSLISRYYSLLKKWADYLGGIAVAPHDTVSADMLSTNNQTNLAIKGIIAIQAMSGISSKLGQTADAQKYSDQAKSLYTEWESGALDSDKHMLLAYGQTPSFSIGYNLFADRWLGTNLVNSAVFDAQAKFIANLKVSGSNTQFGFPIDSSNSTLAAASWGMFAAAALGNGQAQTDIIAAVHNRASFNATSSIFPDRYISSSGGLVGGAGR
ncbi:hypothetical protein OF83DRAFT_1070995 [Amylostereum chailletii]|nr:hypothetical protein OF83DRAFT_1070995 [Amylostereum chailletii]